MVGVVGGVGSGLSSVVEDRVSDWCVRKIRCASLLAKVPAVLAQVVAGWVEPFMSRAIFTVLK